MKRTQSRFGRAAIGLAMAVVVGCEGPAGGAVRDAQGVAADSSAELVAVAAQMERSQSALAVYEVRAGLIQRVWYYPTER